MKNIFVIAISVIVIFTGKLYAANVGGIINLDTVWTEQYSPYYINENGVQIAYGAKLTIEPGVSVVGGRLDVYGVVEARGEPNKIIVFNDVSIYGGENSLSEPFSISLRFCRINGGSLYGPTGDAVYGNLVLTDSFIQKAYGDIYLWYPIADCLIERNVFCKSGGLSIGLSGGTKVYVKNNIFWEQPSTCIFNWCTYDSSETIVEYNSFLCQGRIVLRIPGGNEPAHLSAANNYWGTTDANIIDSMIYDKKDNLSCAGYINYQPALTEPNEITSQLANLWGGNDEAVFAEEIHPGQTIVGATSTATGSDETYDGIDDIYDHWFIFIPNGSIDYTLSLCGSDFDTTLAIFDESCDGELAYNDDFCGYQSQLTYNFQSNRKYYIRIAGFKKQKGHYILSIDDPLVCVNRPLSDLNNDCKVNMLDIAILSSEWLNCGYNHHDACLE